MAKKKNNRKPSRKERRRNKKDEEMDLSIVSDMKEPFTWATFWDEQIVGRIKAIRTFLDEKGILFFLTSPFQYRNRLILKLVVVILGVLLGVVPKTISLINQTKARNASNEMTAIMKNMFTSNKITVTPMASGQYHKTHVLVFKIAGNIDDGVPSTTSGYTVSLASSRGVTDAEHISYKYKVIPVANDTRLLVMYIDNTKQDDETGIFNVDVHIKGADKMDPPMEVVLSNTQKTTSLFADGEIHLSTLSTALSNNGSSDNTPIKDAEDKLKEALSVYSEYEKGLNDQNYEIKPTAKDLRNFVENGEVEYVDAKGASKKSPVLVMTNIEDNSTTKDIIDLNGEIPTLPTLKSTFIIKGDKGAKQEFTDENSTNDLEPNSPQAKELPALTKRVQSVLSAATNLNSMRQTKYQTLKDLSRTLNKSLDIDSMTDGGKVTAENKK